MAQAGAGKLAEMLGTNTPANPKAGVMESLQNALQNPAISTAMLQSGLGLLEGQSGAQAMQGGLGVYNQILQQKARQKQAELDNQYRSRMLEMKEDDQELRRKANESDQEYKERTLKLKEDKFEYEKRKAEEVKNLSENTPTSADPKLWKQALDTVAATTDPGDAVDMAQVYQTYNTMSPNAPIYPAMTGDYTSELLRRMEQNPETAEQYLQTASSVYGPRQTQRLQSLWDKKKSLKEDNESKDKEPVKEAEEGFFDRLFGGDDDGATNPTATGQSDATNETTTNKRGALPQGKQAPADKNARRDAALRASYGGKSEYRAKPLPELSMPTIKRAPKTQITPEQQRIGRYMAESLSGGREPAKPPTGSLGTPKIPDAIKSLLEGGGQEPQTNEALENLIKYRIRNYNESPEVAREKAIAEMDKNRKALFNK